MFFIVIFGTKQIVKTIGTGYFHCVVCNCQQPYHYNQVRTFFSIFFIPIFPIGKSHEYIECSQCKTQYSPDFIQKIN